MPSEPAPGVEPSDVSPRHAFVDYIGLMRPSRNIDDASLLAVVARFKEACTSKHLTTLRVWQSTNMYTPQQSRST